MRPMRWRDLLPLLAVDLPGPYAPAVRFVVLMAVPLLAFLCMSCGEDALPAPGVLQSPGRAAVGITVPAVVSPGEDFTAVLGIAGVDSFTSFQVDVAYDANSVVAAGEEGDAGVVSAGTIDGTRLLTRWAYSPPGTPGRIRIIGRAPAAQATSGTGVLAELHFRATEANGVESLLSLADGLLVDGSGTEITPVVWESALVRVDG